MGQSIPFACQDWANAKGAYRFLSNDRVNEADILAGHFQSTRDRAGAAEGLIFVLHDTTEFTFQREDSSAIGITKSVNSGRDKAGRSHMPSAAFLCIRAWRSPRRGCRSAWPR